MRSIRTILASIVIATYYTTPSTLRADDSPIQVEIINDMERDQEDIRGSKSGDGAEIVKRPKFTAKISNNSLENVSNISVKLYTIGQRFDFSLDKEKTYIVHKVLTQSDLSIPFGKEIEQPLGDDEFKLKETATDKYIYRAGVLYLGYVLEVYQGDNLLLNKFQGNQGTLKKALELYKKNPKAFEEVSP